MSVLLENESLVRYWDGALGASVMGYATKRGREEFKNGTDYRDARDDGCGDEGQ